VVPAFSLPRLLAVGPFSSSIYALAPCRQRRLFCRLSAALDATAFSA